MKKFWLLVSLVTCGILLTWCFKKVEQNPEIIDDCVTVDWEDKCSIDIEEPIVEEINIPTFEELNNVVDKCNDEYYDYNVYQKSYILPYKDWYIWYQLGWQDGWELYLTYRKLGEPCNIIAQTDSIFWWNPQYKEWHATFRWASYPDNKIYIAQWWTSWAPTEEIAKELNCEPGKNFEDQDHTCTEEAEKYFYDLMIWNEENEYFTQWLNKLKEDIDNEDYKTFSYYQEEYDTCSQKVVDLIWALQPNQDEKARWEYQVKRTENMHKCVLENLNK